MGLFRTTRWSLVLETRAASPQAQEALEALCRIYRPPVLAYIRRRGHSPEESEDLTQTFFEFLLRQHSYAHADPQRGRFRSFLLTALKHFLINQHAQAHAGKRGGGNATVLLDEYSELADSDANHPDQVFERTYALTVIARGLSRLEEEAGAAGKHALFLQLRDYLLESPDSDDYSALAQRLQLRRNTVAVAVHRMRNRLRELVRAELTETVDSAAALQVELASLRQAIGTRAAALRAS